MRQNQKYWCVVPAAGVGRRVGGDKPKQYLDFNIVDEQGCEIKTTIAEATLSRLFTCLQFEGIVVAISADDTYWHSLDVANHSLIKTVNGGRERSDSVLNALYALSHVADASDWILVHDIARPCVRVSDIESMIKQLLYHDCGGILAAPVVDTLKKVASADNVDIEITIDRSLIWRAFTPQMFRFGPLLKALQYAASNNFLVTDEASAIEYSGLVPKLVYGREDNIKVTGPEDLRLAEYYLREQAKTK